MFAQQLNSGSALYGKSNLLSEFRKSIDQLNFLRSQKKTDTSSYELVLVQLYEYVRISEISPSEISGKEGHTQLLYGD
jgi:hypothetical protein